jgi:hypothetical protein
LIFFACQYVAIHERVADMRHHPAIRIALGELFEQNATASTASVCDRFGQMVDGFVTNTRLESGKIEWVRASGKPLIEYCSPIMWTPAQTREPRHITFPFF